MSNGSSTLVSLSVQRPFDILAVDDMPINLELLEEILSTRGHRLRTALSGEEALQRIAEKTPDLIILDVMMPGMDGFEVCENIKTREATSGIPVIFVTSLDQTGHKLEAFHAGAADYITRPFEPLEVLARVENQLSLRDLQTRLETKVRERTAELSDANRDLQEEIQERRRAELELKESHQRLRELSAHLLNSREEERAEIAREIHDELGATFTALSFDLGWIDKHFEDRAEEARQRVSQLRQDVAAAADVARRIQTELRPNILDDLGLAEALSWLAGRFADKSGIVCRFHNNSAEEELPENIRVAIFRIAQEALTNIARHAQASHASLTLSHDGEALILEVLDDGIGINQETFTKQGSYGIRGMRERAWALSATIEALRRPEGGTRISIRVPAKKQG
jgi:signal transduction histidine kinase